MQLGQPEVELANQCLTSIGCGCCDISETNCSHHTLVVRKNAATDTTVPY